MLSILLCLGTGGTAIGQSAEYQIKAAFLFKFAKYAQWPADTLEGTNGPIVLGVLGKNPFKGLLERTVKGKRIGERPLKVQYFHQVEEVSDCHLLFIGQSEDSQLEENLDQLREKNLLTVSEIGGFARRGGIIRLYISDNRLNFNINVDAADRAGIKLGSQLLKLARIVGDDLGQED